MSLVTVNNLTLAYGEKIILKNLSFDIQKGDFLVIMGENGIGKTTLVRAILGQLKPQQGTITLAPNLKIGYVPQFRNLDTEYPLAIRDFVTLNLPLTLIPWPTKKERAKVATILKQTNLVSIADRPLGMASGGEKQRAYLAQALLADPQLLILDESTASLDNEMKYEVLDLVESIRQQGVAVLFITHDKDLACRYGTRFLNFEPGHYTDGPISELIKSKGRIK